MNHRDLAQTHLNNAKDELSSKEEKRIKYAALELRMAMEAVTYERALAYKDEFPPEEYGTWQPKKVMAVLLDIDPLADKDSSIAVGVEEEYGVPAPEMKFLGKEAVLNMKVIKKHYDAIGSYLHIQSIKQLKNDVPLNNEKLRKRCVEISSYLEKVLLSPVFNITIGNISTIECMECNSPIRKRLAVGKDEAQVKCYGCGATYTVTKEGEKKVKWEAQNQEVSCANRSCSGKSIIWRNELEVGRYWECSECGGENSFVLALQHKSKDA